MTRYSFLLLFETYGFNPCFGGSYIVTMLSKSPVLIMSMFQSLFWWILYCDPCFIASNYPCRNVSILVLVDLIL